MSKKSRVGAAIAAALLVSAALGGCSWGNHTSDNSSNTQPTGPADVLQFPYGFRNVAHKCDGPNMVYVASAGQADNLPSGIAVVANDPRCTAAAK
jgi:hypothetical protein